MRDAAVKNVTYNGNRSPFEVAKLFDERVNVEQRLRRVRVHAVARVDDVTVKS